MSSKRYEKICAQCGKPFIAKLSRTKFCSKKCSNQSCYERKKKLEESEVINSDVFGYHTKTCEVCGKEFTAQGGRAKYCSRKCLDLALYHRKHPNQRVYRNVCAYCGKTFNTTYADKNYCSSNCLGRSKKVAKCDSRFEEIARRADECGLSYGKYKLQLKLGKTYEELKAAHLAEFDGKEEF